MSLFDTVLEALKTAGGTTGTAGGILATYVFTKFRELEKANRESKRRSLESETGVREQIELARKDALQIRQDVQKRLESIARGSKQDIKFSLDEASERRLFSIEQRLSAIEDDLDKKSEKDRESWETVQRTLGRIEGTLGQRMQKLGE